MNFTVYKSSAGSGKTFTLVKEYLKLALTDNQSPPQKYRHILAITFTNKAAAEMKDRIIAALKELSEKTETKNSLAEIIKTETKLSDEQLKYRSAMVLNAILHNYSDFAVGTIDSFVHRIVRTFAYDLQLPVNFEIEMDGDRLLKEAIDSLISQVGTNEELTRALVEFIESKTDDEKSWHIENDLFEFSKNLLTDESSIHLDKLKNISTSDFLRIRNTLNESIKKFENTLLQIASKAHQVVVDKGVSTAAFYNGSKGITKYFEYIVKHRFDMLVPNNLILKTIHEDKWFSKKATEEDKANIEAIKPQLINAFHNIQGIVEKQQASYLLYKLISKNIYALAVLNEIQKVLEEIKKQNNILHISEFNKVISAIVRSQPIPFIYERIGEKYNHYLVDEFQDTSVLQWQNLLPLVENSLAEGHFSMLVGDGKQAIYRWRGGEVAQFAKLPKVSLHQANEFTAEREQTLIRNYKEKQLVKNYRSKTEIISFNNSLFSFLSSKLIELHQTIYHKLEQESNPENTGGYISIDFIKGDKEETEQLTLEGIYNAIVEFQKDNFSLNDIAILCRSNKTGSIIAEYLTAKNIGVISSDSLLLNNSNKVRFLESILHYINQPDNEIARVEILQYLVESGIVVNDLHTLISAIKGKQAWEFDAVLKKYAINLNHNLLVKLPLYELIENLIRSFKLAECADASVQFFMDEVLNYSTKHSNNLSEFIEWWDKRKEKASVVVPDESNAVTILTVHRSKGLEFPAVILPFANWKITNTNNYLWIDLQHNEIPLLKSVLLPTNKTIEQTSYAELYIDEQNKSLLDTINLLYVALTRPEERLCIITGEQSKNPDNLTTISDMLCTYLQQQNKWNEHQAHYEIGNRTKHQAKSKKQKTIVKQTKIQSTDWRNILKIRANAPDVWNIEDVDNKKDFGLIVHAILAKIKTKKDILPTLIQFLNDGLIDSEEQKSLLVKLTNIIDNKAINEFYADGNIIKSEAAIILPTGEVYRPDRVILNNTTTTVIDYKTGLKQEKHAKQIKKYAELLAEMGYPNIHQYLVYIDDESIVKV